MQLKAVPLEIEAGGPLVVVMNQNDAAELGVISSDRIFIRHKDFHAICILNISGGGNLGELGVYKEVTKRLELQKDSELLVEPARRPESLDFVREKINGQRLTSWKIERIVSDVVERHLSDIELASFVTALHVHGVSMEENEALSRSMIWSGKTIDFGRSPILDKHSIGGVPGDKTTLIVTPAIAAAGYTIPKSSSRAITSPAGTADRMEAIAPVNIAFDDIMDIVNKVGACIVWGGSIDLAPADDLFIRVEYPLSIDPLLLPSILSKKKAMGSTHVVIDIPVGVSAKINTMNEAEQLANDFIELGGRFDMRIECAITEGSQPIGYCVGPVLEAREALETLYGNGPHDLVDKATNLTGILLEMVGQENGKQMAIDLITKGKALAKMKEIIEAQGGDPEIKPEDLVPGRYFYDVPAPKNGRVLFYNNRDLVRIARSAGTPNSKGAGIQLFAKTGDKVEKGKPMYRIYSESQSKLNNAIKQLESQNPMEIGTKVGEDMLKMRISKPTAPSREFILDR
ncbi:MAG: AMP phosphorylase [Candidatus Bathyarchaeota archaeon]|nr:AMP phosphorylase [Candidatus Bathyarchaeota archaeon]